MTLSDALAEVFDRKDSFGLVDAVIGDNIGGRDVDWIINSFKSLFYPKALPLAVFLVGSATTVMVVSLALNKLGVADWRWYFRWPVVIGGVAIATVVWATLLELVTDQHFDSDPEENPSWTTEKRERVRRIAYEELPEPSNIIESDGAGGLRRRINEFKIKEIDWATFPGGMINATVTYTTDLHKDTSQSDYYLKSPYIKYKRRKPHWEKNWSRINRNKWVKNL